MKVEVENAKEEILDIIEKCMKCGLCKAKCPVFKIMREESFSARGKVLILEKKVYDDILYKCCLCKSCENNCPVEIRLSDAFRKAREILANSGCKIKEAENALKNIQETGNIFGD